MFKIGSGSTSVRDRNREQDRDQDQERPNKQASSQRIVGHRRPLRSQLRSSHHCISDFYGKNRILMDDGLMEMEWDDRGEINHQDSHALEAATSQSEYSRMPPLHALEPYNECLLEPGDVYCVVDAGLFADPDNQLMNMITEYSAYTRKHFNHTQIHRGVCVTRSCSKFTTDKNLNKTEDIKAVLDLCLNESLWNDYELQVRVENIVNCDRPKEKMTIDGLDIFMAVVYGVIMFINIIGNLYDMIWNKGNKNYGGNKFLLCFSLRRNWAKLIAPSGVGPEPRLERLKFFQSVRTLTMICVLFFHVFILMHTMYLDNPVFIENLYSNPSQLFFLNGSVLVQTFFVMSAFLLAFNYQLHAERHNPTWSDIPKGILIRWIRITPTYLLVLGTVCTWFRHMGSGPLWYSLVESEAQVCRRYWWLHPLYLNNYVYGETFCMLQAWYLAADMQLFYMGLAVCVLARSPRVRRTVLWILFIVAIIGPAAEAYVLNLDATFMQTPESMRLVYAKSDVFKLTHIPAHMNLAPYVLGLAAGFLTYRLQIKQLDLSKYKKYCWLYWSLLPLGICLIFSGGIFFKDGFEAPLGLRVAHASLYKPIFHMTVLAGVIGVMFKYESIFRGVLEWGGWTWCGRVSYGAYLLHFMFQKGLYGAMRTTHMFDYFTLVVLFSTTFMTYLLAVLLWLLVEEPLNQLSKVLLRNEPKKDVNGNKNMDTEVHQTRC